MGSGSLRLSVIARILLALMVSAGFVTVLAYRGAIAPLAIKEAVAAYPMAPLAFIAASVVASLIFVPRTILAVAAGLLFGLWWGLLWITIGSTLGSVAGFLLARYVNSGLIDPARMPLLGRMLEAAERGDWRTVAFIRVIPYLPHTPLNYALALTRLSFGSYTLGSLLGMIPSSFAAVQLGASGESALSGRDWIKPLAVALVLLAATAILPRLPWVRRWMRW